MKTEKYIKPEIEVIALELAGAVMETSPGYKLGEGEYSGPAGAPKRRRSFWEDNE